MTDNNKVSIYEKTFFTSNIYFDKKENRLFQLRETIINDKIQHVISGYCKCYNDCITVVPQRNQTITDEYLKENCERITFENHNEYLEVYTSDGIILNGKKFESRSFLHIKGG